MQGTIIEVMVKNDNSTRTVKLLKESTWSVGSIGASSDTRDEFASFLTSKQEIPAATSRFYQYHLINFDLPGRSSYAGCLGLTLLFTG